MSTSVYDLPPADYDPDDMPETTRPLYRSLHRLPLEDRLDAALANLSVTGSRRDERRADRALRNWTVTR